RLMTNGFMSLIFSFHRGYAPEEIVEYCRLRAAAVVIRPGRILRDRNAGPSSSRFVAPNRSDRSQESRSLVREKKHHLPGPDAGRYFPVRLFVSSWSSGMVFVR